MNPVAIFMPSQLKKKEEERSEKLTITPDPKYFAKE
jgi:hypothetical protein